jgi:hypothetical protein
VQSKILTADKLLARNWMCDPRCILCDQTPETAVHLCLQCVFAREVWHLVSSWSAGLIHIPAQDVYLECWWNDSVCGGPKHQRPWVAAILMYSLRFHIRSRLGHRHGHQSTTLTSLFYTNLYWKVIYVYSYESNFQDKSIYTIFTFSNSTT